MDSLDDRELVECPFDPLHRMLRNRLQKHILRCRLNHPDANLQTCPYNLIHLIPEEDFKKHVTNCPDRKIVEGNENVEPTVKAEVHEERTARAQQLPKEFEENWDDDQGGDFDPRDLPVAPDIVRMPQHYHKAERRAFMKQERERLGEMPPTPSPPRLNDADSEDDLEPGDISVKTERANTPDCPPLDSNRHIKAELVDGNIEMPTNTKPPIVHDPQRYSYFNKQHNFSHRGYHRGSQRQWRNENMDRGKRTHRDDRSELVKYAPYPKYPRQRNDQSHGEYRSYNQRAPSTITSTQSVIKTEAADDHDDEFERAYSNLPMYGKRKNNH